VKGAYIPNFSFIVCLEVVVLWLETKSNKQQQHFHRINVFLSLKLELRWELGFRLWLTKNNCFPRLICFELIVVAICHSNFRPGALNMLKSKNVLKKNQEKSKGYFLSILESHSLKCTSVSGRPIHATLSVIYLVPDKNVGW
jgi:hypothetical protein